jgi:hypothetical protein
MDTLPLLQLYRRAAVPALAPLGSSKHMVAAVRGRSRWLESISQRWSSWLPQMTKRIGQKLEVQVFAPRHKAGSALTTRIWLSNVQR